MRFCPECGAPVLAGAKFCIECGKGLAAEPKPASSGLGIRITPAFVAVFGGIVLCGTLATVVLLRQTKQPSSTAKASLSPAAEQNLPPGHPKVDLPQEARKFIEDLESKAKSKPNDLAQWNRLGEVSFRASMFDASYYNRAAEAWNHVLKLDPDNLDALRGVGNLNYDRRNYDEATAAYEHYLKIKPDDPEVRTDLGTMNLYTGNPDQAVIQYKKAIALKPDLFEGYYNLGVAYGEQNDDKQAKAAFDKALSLAPDDKARDRVKEMLAKLDGGAPAAAGSAAVAEPGKAAVPADFAAAIEQMVRAVPFAGPKVKALEWPTPRKAKVVMDNFPMEQMPPFARAKFLGDLKNGIQSVKSSHKISEAVELELVDGQSGRVMESVSD